MDRPAPTLPLPPDTSGVGSAIALDELRQPATREAHAAWQGQRKTRRMPSRAEMTPRVMLKFLSFVALAELIDGGADFRFRVVGDGIGAKQKLSLTGKTLTEVDLMVPGFGRFLKGIYMQTALRGEPTAFRGAYMRKADKHPFNYEAVILPLGADGETVDHVLVVSV